MYRIRLHGRGGQGIKTAGRILGTAFFLEGYEVQDAPRYGAERRGAPILAFVRADRRPVQERGLIRRPDLVAVADETLLPVPTAGVLAGVDAHTVLVVQSQEPAEAWAQRLSFPGRLLTLPTPAQAEDPVASRSAGVRCAGAAARLTGVLARERLEEAIRTEIAPLGEGAVQRSLVAALEAYDRMAPDEGVVQPAPAPPADGYRPPAWVDLTWEDARAATPAVHAAATSALVPTGLWRTLRPVVDHAHCSRCWWVCSTLCPDGAIRVNADGRPEIDYDHCKGCLVCVAVCPPHAIRAVPEAAARAVETGS